MTYQIVIGVIATLEQIPAIIDRLSSPGQTMTYKITPVAEKAPQITAAAQPVVTPKAKQAKIMSDVPKAPSKTSRFTCLDCGDVFEGAASGPARRRCPRCREHYRQEGIRKAVAAVEDGPEPLPEEI